MEWKPSPHGYTAQADVCILNTFSPAQRDGNWHWEAILLGVVPGENVTRSGDAPSLALAKKAAESCLHLLAAGIQARAEQVIECLNGVK